MTLDFKARIAAKKAALLAESGTVQPVTQEQANASVTIDVPSREVSMLEAMGLDAPVSTVLEEAVKPEPAPAPEQKPMTFAERIAAKKKLAEASAPAPAASAASTPTQAKISMVPAMPAVVSLTADQLEVIQNEENSELAQAYSDVALMVNKLQYALDGEPLAGAMSDLKKALKQNASACMLLLDSDIGQMTLALRRHTGVELAEVTKEKKSSGGTKAKKASTVVLTPEEIALALATDF